MKFIAFGLGGIFVLGWILNAVLIVLLKITRWKLMKFQYRNEVNQFKGAIGILKSIKSFGSKDDLHIAWEYFFNYRNIRLSENVTDIKLFNRLVSLSSLSIRATVVMIIAILLLLVLNN